MAARYCLICQREGRITRLRTGRKYCKQHRYSSLAQEQVRELGAVERAYLDFCVRRARRWKPYWVLAGANVLVAWWYSELAAFFFVCLWLWLGWNGGQAAGRFIAHRRMQKRHSEYEAFLKHHGVGEWEANYERPAGRGIIKGVRESLASLDRGRRRFYENIGGRRPRVRKGALSKARDIGKGHPLFRK